MIPCHGLGRRLSNEPSLETVERIMTRGRQFLASRFHTRAHKPGQRPQRTRRFRFAIQWPDGLFRFPVGFLPVRLEA